MNAIAILQARMSSSRLPGKVMLEINGKPMIYWQIQRILEVPQIKKLVVATSGEPSDDILVKFLRNEGIEVFRGSLDDVHSRYLAIINSYPDTKTFLRLTADCPLTMPLLIVAMLKEFDCERFDYYSNSMPPTYPDGLDVEIFTKDSFLSMSKSFLSTHDKEHVTLKYRAGGANFRIGEKLHTDDLSYMRWTVDYEDDFNFVKKIIENFEGRESTFSFEEVLELLRVNPDLNTQMTGTLRNIALEGRE